MPTNDEDGQPEVGVGSVQWFKKMADGQKMAAGVGSFLGSLFGKIMTPPQVRLNPRGDMIIKAGRGVDVLIDRNNLGILAQALLSREPTYHLWMSDADLETDPATRDPHNT